MGEPVEARLGLGRTLVVVLTYPFFALAFVLLTIACALDRLLPLPLPFPRNHKTLAKRQAWCVARLTEAGALPVGALVTRFEVTPFKRGEAFRSALAQVAIDYTHDGRAQAFACVAKLAPEGGGLLTQVIAVIQRTAQNEVDFYRTFAELGVLRSYYARAAGLAGRCCILLERVEPVFEIAEEAGAPIEVARDVVTLLARFHARHWQTSDAPPPKVPQRVPGSAIDFMCSLAWGSRRMVLRHLARASWHHGNRPQTIVHGDARIGNVLFREQIDGIPTNPVLIDWQATRWGLGVYDLAYFATLSLDSAVREAHEPELLRLYHDTLTASGVTLDFDALVDDYRHSLLLVGSLLVVPLLGGEVTIDDDNRARILSGGLVWHARLARMLDTLDGAWLARNYGVDAETLRATVAWTSAHPPFLNRGAVLVARELAARDRAASAH